MIRRNKSLIISSKKNLEDPSILDLQNEEDYRSMYMNRIKGHEELYDFDYLYEKYKSTRILDSDIDVFNSMSDENFYKLAKRDDFVDTVYAKIPQLRKKINNHLMKIYRIKIENEFGIALIHKLNIMLYEDIIEISKIINNEWLIAKERIQYIDNKDIRRNLQRFIDNFEGITWNRGVERAKVDIMAFFDDPQGYDRTDVLITEIIPQNTTNYVLYDMYQVFPFWKWTYSSSYIPKYGKLKRNPKTGNVEGIYFRGKLIRKTQIVQLIDILTSNVDDINMIEE